MNTQMISYKQYCLNENKNYVSLIDSCFLDFC